MVSPARSRAGNSPVVGLSPMTPHQAAGMRMDPAPSLPVASGTMPAATAAAEPADEPPGDHAGWWGLQVGPRSVCPHVCQAVAEVGTDVIPIGTHPAASSRWDCTDSRPSLAL